MPTYSYKCEDCEKDIDIQATIEEKVANAPDKFVCPQCGSAKIKQNFSLNALIEKADKGGGCCTPGDGDCTPGGGGCC